MLAPTLFLLWSASLTVSLRAVPGVMPFLYAGDTAALCAGNDIEIAKRRAQQAAECRHPRAVGAALEDDGGR